MLPFVTLPFLPSQRFPPMTARLPMTAFSPRTRWPRISVKQANKWDKHQGLVGFVNIFIFYECYGKGKANQDDHMYPESLF
jgi:hypothetical protein